VAADAALSRLTSTWISNGHYSFSVRTAATDTDGMRQVVVGRFRRREARGQLGLSPGGDIPAGSEAGVRVVALQAASSFSWSSAWLPGSAE